MEVGSFFFSLAKNYQELGADPYQYIHYVLHGNACSGQEQVVVGLRHTTHTSTQTATFATRGGRQVHARTNDKGANKTTKLSCG